MQNRAQMKESECAKDILKCANKKQRSDQWSFHKATYNSQGGVIAL